MTPLPSSDHDARPLSFGHEIRIRSIYFGVVSTMILETAAITPPVALIFSCERIGQIITMSEIIIGSAPFVLLYILAIGSLFWFRILSCSCRNP